MTRRRSTYRGVRDPHGLYLFCSVVMIVAVGLIGFGLLWVVNK